MTSGYKVRCAKCKTEYSSADRSWSDCQIEFCLLKRHAFGGGYKDDTFVPVNTEDLDDVGKRKNRNKFHNVDYDRGIVMQGKKRKLEKIDMVEVRCEEDKHVFHPHSRSYANEDDYTGGYEGGGFYPHVMARHHHVPSAINMHTPGARWNTQTSRWEVPMTLQDDGKGCPDICGVTGTCTTECEAMKDTRVVGDDDIPVLH